MMNQVTWTINTNHYLFLHFSQHVNITNVHGSALRLKKPEAQKSAKGPRAPGAGFEAKARAFQTQGALLLKKCLKIIPKPYLF